MKHLMIPVSVLALTVGLIVTNAHAGFTYITPIAYSGGGHHIAYFSGALSGGCGTPQHKAASDNFTLHDKVNWNTMHSCGIVTSGNWWNNMGLSYQAWQLKMTWCDCEGWSDDRCDYGSYSGVMRAWCEWN
jgi:hypothetical protein